MTKYYDFKTIVYGDDKIMVGDFVDLKFSGQHGKIRKVVYKIGPVKCLPDVVEPEIGMNTDAWLISGEVRDLDTTEWRHTREFKKPRVVMASKNTVEISTNEMKTQKISIEIKKCHHTGLLGRVKVGDALYVHTTDYKFDKFVVMEVLPTDEKNKFKFVVFKIKRLYHVESDLIEYL